MKVAKEILAVAKELLAAEVVTKHETIRLGGGIYAVINADRSLEFWSGSRPLAMIDAQQARKLADAIQK
jgi:hypothetical protein